MKHVSILIPEGDCSLVNIEGTHHILTQVNGLLAQQGKPALFDIHLVGLSRESRLKKGFFAIVPDKVLAEVPKTSLIIIPAIHGDMKANLAANQEFLPWIVSRYKEGATIASLCIGSFLLASTGLLKGRNCATHWVEAARFKSMFPDVHLVPDKIITDEQGICTSGGAYSSVNLIIYLVEKYAGRDMAILCSKLFEIDIDRDSQSSFMIFQGQKEHGDEPIVNAQNYIETNFHDKITVDEISEKFALSRRNLERRFKKATHNSIVEYMQRVRIEAAKLKLESSRENVNEVMWQVGYTDTKAFRTTFKKITGLSPVAYRSRYSGSKDVK